ncbi:MAG: hypothetical protein AAF789_06730 [Bacteroidota bacterium]
MFSNLSHKQKFFGLQALFIVALAAGYLLSFKKTINLVQRNTELKKLIEEDDGLLRQVVALRKRKQSVDSLLAVMKTDQSKAFLIEAVVASANQHNVKLEEIVETVKSNAIQYTCVFEGNFIQHVKLINYLERYLPLVMIRNVHYYVVTPRRSNAKSLKMKLVFEANEVN